MADLAVTQRVLVPMVWEVNISHFAAMDKYDFSSFVFSNNIGSDNYGAYQDSTDQRPSK